MNLQNESKKRQKRESRSAIIRPYKIVSYLSVALFLGLISYMIYFQVVKSEELLNSPLNKRQDEVEAQVIRGSVLASDGTPLAVTYTDDYGEPYRQYPYGALFAHTVGYSVYGGSGLESSHNNDLIHSHLNIVNQVQNELSDEKKPGDDLVTTLHTDLQQAAWEALGGFGGTAVVMDAQTGDILANVSTPAFDPNTVSADWEWLTESENGIFLNRALQGLYPPGSTFKIITALAYYRQYGSFDNFYYDCQGSYEYAGFTIHCANGHVHGPETIADAMANSCNCAFASMAVEKIDKNILRKTAEEFGFNKEMTMDLPFIESIFELDAGTADQLTMQTAIGQGDTLATPMLMCMIAQAVANNGKMMMPNYLDRIQSADGNVVKRYSSSTYGQVMSEQEAMIMKDLLRGVVQRGTAADLADLPYDIAGKTGTAEYGDISAGTAHSWFVGFSNTGNRDIVVSVLVENGGNGIAPGTQVARRIFQTWFGY